MTQLVHIHISNDLTDSVIAKHAVKSVEQI